jgi:Uma2 family endonuclease
VIIVIGAPSPGGREERIMATTVHKSKARAEAAVWPLVVRLRPAVDLSEDQLFELCLLNRDLRIERNAEGELLIMPPAGWETSDRNSEINLQLRRWAKRDGTGAVTDSSGGYTLPNGATRAPDAAWIARARLDPILTPRRERFLPVCPDFVLELRSPSDRLQDLHDKMREYLANGAQLGWLLDPEPRHIYVYRPGAPVERLENPETISGDSVLPGFVLDLREV